MLRSILSAMLLVPPCAAQAQPIDAKTQGRIDRILKATPLIDGHNDLPWALRENHESSVDALEADTDKRAKPLQTDIARMRQGRVGAQFWSVYLPASFAGDAAIKGTLEQIDIVRRLVARYPRDFELATTAADIRRIHKAGRIASLMGIEGGHQIAGSLAALRQFRALGAGYMTLTHFKNNEWADSGTDDAKHGGLTPFGEGVVREMNRIGMLVDLSHVSAETMTDTLKIATAPVIFSHSDVRALADTPRNVPDAVLRLLPANGGVVMVNFYPGHLSQDVRLWGAARAAEEARVASLLVAQPDARKVALAAWDSANPRPSTPLGVVADHIDHVAKVAGHDHVGIGADLDGIDFAAEGLGSVDSYPLLFAELIRRGWSDANLAKLAGGNVLRVMARAETVAAR